MENNNIQNLLSLDRKIVSDRIDSLTLKERECIRIYDDELDTALSNELRSVIAVRKLEELPKRKIKFALSTGVLISIINTIIFNGIDMFLPGNVFTAPNIIGSITAQILVNNIFAFNAFNRTANLEHKDEIESYHEECVLKVESSKDKLKNSYTTLLQVLKRIKEELLELKENSNYLDNNEVSSIDIAIKEVDYKIGFTESKLRIRMKG